MKLSTSTRISFGFTFLTVLILSVFSFTIYHTFNQNRQRSEKRILNETLGNKPPSGQPKKPPKSTLNTRFQKTIIIENTDPLFQELRLPKKKNGIVHNEGRAYFFSSNKNLTAFRDITSHKKRQDKLRQLFLFAVLFGGAVSFFLGRYFVTWVMKDLRTLADKIKALHIDKLSFGHQLDHLPEGDEILLLANTLTRMAESLRSQVDDMKQFVSNAAHELRTPLTILRSSSDLAIRTKEYEQEMPKIQTTIREMETLISTLLLLARNKTNGFQKEQIYPSETILYVVEQLEQKRIEKKIQVKVDIKDSKIHAHQGSFERIIHNLLDNAFKYSPEGGTISISLDKKSCRISDTGPGISEKDIAHIWTPFRQADESRGVDGGFGLGLALVQRLVHLHGRTIQVLHSDENGTTFTLSWNNE